MNIAFKVFICLMFTCLILLGFDNFRLLAQDAKVEIKIEGADVIREMQLTPSADLKSIAKAVSSRIVIEYADSVSESVLIVSKEVSTLAKSVPDRVIVEYADLISSRDCEGSQALKKVAGIVTPRIIIEYADLCSTKSLVNFFKDPIIPPTSSISSFKMALDKGLNMISLPVKPDTSLTARSFANNIGSTVVIRYDTKEAKFLPFVPDVSQGDGFAIEGGRGYIVNVSNSKEFVFTGTAWSNAPSKLAPNNVSKTNWAFVVCGTILDGDRIEQNDNLAVTVKNLRTSKLIESEAGQVENGRYSVAFVDMSKNSVINSGDSLAIYLKDNTKGVLSKPIIQKVIISDLDKSFVTIPLNTKYFIPEKSVLLQNYPNPFNPETWIPYQLKEDNNVVIRIYSSSGSLVRSLNLGHKSAGYYEGKERAAHWDGKNEVGEKVASGIYFYSIKAGSFVSTRKMVITE